MVIDVHGCCENKNKKLLGRIECTAQRGPHLESGEVPYVPVCRESEQSAFSELDFVAKALQPASSVLLLTSEVGRPDCPPTALPPMVARLSVGSS